MNISYRSRFSSRHAFTLIEILIVLAIIGILAAILLPAFSNARESARRASCQSNLKQMHLALQLYLQDFGGVYPRPWRYSSGVGVTCSWPDRLWPYLHNTSIFLCPDADATRYQYQPGCLPDEQTDDGPILFDGSYDINSYAAPGGGSRVMDFHFRHPSSTILIVDGTGDSLTFGSPGTQTATVKDLLDLGLQARHNNGVNALFADGHVHWQSAESLTHKGLWTLKPND